MKYFKKMAVATVCGIGALSVLNPAVAESNLSSFSAQSSILTIPALKVDETNEWFGDITIEMNLSTNKFNILGIRGIDALTADELGCDAEVNSRIEALEALVVESPTVDEALDIDARLTALEEVITTPISEEGSSMQSRLAALESVYSPTIVTANIQPGRYVDSVGTCFELSEPLFYSETRSSYFLEACDNSTMIVEILTGPLEGYPAISAERLSNLILPDNRIYGLVTNDENIPNYENKLYTWYEGSLIGFRQIGDRLSMEVYTKPTDTRTIDAELPYETITLTREE